MDTRSTPIDAIAFFKQRLVSSPVFSSVRDDDANDTDPPSCNDKKNTTQHV
jgi:hypothetical protein